MKTTIPDPAALHIPSNWYRHYRKLQTLRDELMEDRADRMTTIVEGLEPHGMDDADSATDEFDHNLTLGILSHEEDALFEVDSAIQRILDGTYGVCEATGKPIPEARLQVVPWTRYTREALERIETRHAGKWPHLADVIALQGRAPGGLPDAPEPADLVTTETSRREKRGKISDFAGETEFTITPNSTLES